MAKLCPKDPFMSRIPFVHARFPDPDETEIALARRLRDHLRKLRAARLVLSEDEGAMMSQLMV